MSQKQISGFLNSQYIFSVYFLKKLAENILHSIKIYKKCFKTKYCERRLCMFACEY